MSVGRIENPAVSVKVSKKLIAFIKRIEDDGPIPAGIKTLKNDEAKITETCKPTDHKYLMTEEDYKDLGKLTKHDSRKELLRKPATSSGMEILSLEDLHWVYNKVREHNANNKNKIYLHELLEDCNVVLPRNSVIPRNPELEKRCNTLKVQQENVRYKDMTKNVDSARRNHPEDSISYQVNQLNRHLIAVAQFIVSVLAGFAFGFVGLEYMLGSLDFGFRLLLGIICALIIALAELYFLAKKLNQEANFEAEVLEMNKHPKID